MKVLLVQSPSGRREPPVFPIGLAFLAGRLRGFETRAIDLSLHGDPAGALREAVADFSPGMVALSLRNIDDSSWPSTWSYVEPFASVLEPLEGWDGTVVAGGPGFTIYATELMERFRRIDAGVAGEGEDVIAGLASSAASLRRSGRLLEPPRPSLEGLSPDLSILPLDPYEPHYGIGVQSRRGCAFGCTYCTYAHLGGHGFRARPVRDVMADISGLADRGVRRFQFVDPVFDQPRQYFEELLASMARGPSGMEWAAWPSLDVSGGDLEAMSASGCRKVDFSPDAVTARGMRLLGKRGSFDDIRRVVRSSVAAGLETGVNFFNGNPGEGLPELLLKLAFLLRSRLGRGRVYVNVGTIRIYRGSRLAEDYLASGLVPPGTTFLEPVFAEPSGPSRALFRIFQGARQAAGRLRRGVG